MRLVAEWEVKGLGGDGGGVGWGAYESLRRIWGPYFNSDSQKLAYMVGAIRERKRGIASAERERKKGVFPSLVPRECLALPIFPLFKPAT